MWCARSARLAAFAFRALAFGPRAFGFVLRLLAALAPRLQRALRPIEALSAHLLALSAEVSLLAVLLLARQFLELG
jgi:hypothetical protein